MRKFTTNENIKILGLSHLPLFIYSTIQNEKIIKTKIPHQR